MVLDSLERSSGVDYWIRLSVVPVINLFHVVNVFEAYRRTDEADGGIGWALLESEIEGL